MDNLSLDDSKPTNSKATITATAPSHSNGRMFVRVVEARQLLVRRPKNSKPYCVVQFEGNEFVTKEAYYLDESSSKVEIEDRHIVKKEPVWKHEAVFDVTRPDGEIIVSIYDRNTDSNEEDFLGYVKIRPPRLNDRVHDNWFRLLPRQWKEKCSGDLHLQMVFKTGTSKSLASEDFELLRVLGKGSFGKVVQVRKKDTGRIYAMKILYKKDIVERQEVTHTMSERNILKHTNFPFLVGLKFAFQTQDKLYLILDFMNGGELFYHLQQARSFGEERAKFYAAEILLALEHLHKNNVIYRYLIDVVYALSTGRDLKPENILLDSNGHVALTDFGLCKENMTPESITKTFCGTAEYLAPEILLGQGYGRAVDWWSLGILIFEMITGLPPFYSDNHNAMYRKILYGDVEYPAEISKVGRNIISQLLNRDAKTRLGSGPGDALEIKKHQFFADINWDALVKKEVKVPFKPAVQSEADASNFDPAFTSQKVNQDSNSDKADLLSTSVQKEFQGFTYTQESVFSSSLEKKDGGLTR